MKNSQLIKENKIAGGYTKVYPLAYVQGIYDSNNGKNLEDILKSFNHIYLPFKESVRDTRSSLPIVYRRKGVFITYRVEEELVTEVYIGKDNDVNNNPIFSADINWELVPDLEYIHNSSSKIPNGTILPEHLSSALWELLSRDHIITNFPDDEDLTQQCKVLKFKDRKYNPGLSSGKGYKILRKNWVGQYNILNKDDINHSNTIYEIRYDFDLQGQEITLMKDCVLLFKGGSLNNGTIICNNTNIVGINKFEDAGNAVFEGTFNRGLIMAKEDTIMWYDGIEWKYFMTKEGTPLPDYITAKAEAYDSEIAEAAANVNAETGEFSFRFGIPKGKDGRDGIDGKDGLDGKDGVSPKGGRTVAAFKHSETKPSTPVGGSWNTITNTIVLPFGWSFDDALLPPIWMSIGEFTSDDPNNPKWSDPVKISGLDGLNGLDGEDGSITEYIYRRSTRELTIPEDTPPSDPNISDYVPEHWEDHPLGISLNWPFEYVCIRYKNLVTGLWSNWQGPTLWSKWGIDGKDGDGVEYIYQLTKTEVMPVTPGKVAASDSPTTNYQEKEFLPASADGENPWTDNPTGVSTLYLCEWVSVRKFSQSTQLWGDFSRPALWAKYGEKGDPGTSINILGSYDSLEALLAALAAGTLTGNNPPQIGDAYIVNGDIYIWDGDEFINAGRIKGEPGESYYLHIKYSNDGRTFTAEDGEEIGKYIGIRVDSNPVDSLLFSDYTWSQFRGNDGFGYEYIFKISDKFEAPDVPTEITDTDVAPEGWTDDPTGVDSVNKYEWCCYRKSDENGKWGPWKGKQGGSKAWLFAMYAESVAGATGQLGPIIYPAGLFDKTKTYTLTIKVNALGEEYIHAIPYVLYGGEFYLLQVPTFTGEYPSTEDGSWLKMDKFDAIYTDILLANNALVGSAVFNGAYMFSLQGIKKDGSFSLEYDKFIHGDPFNPNNEFRPNWCVNLRTGELWIGAGKIYFAKDGSGRLANNNISWDASGNISINQGVGAKFNADGSGQLSDGNIKWDSNGTTKIGGIKINSDGIGTNVGGLIRESVFIGKDGIIKAGSITEDLIVNKGYPRTNKFDYDNCSLSIESVGAAPNGGNPAFSDLVRFKFDNYIFRVSHTGIYGSKDGGTTWIDLLEGGGSSSGGNVEFVDSLPSNPSKDKLYVII